mmetsp:Transcript_39758/g.63181  ORF Transcript_39758/g.63181 Transcript_39758/m.63181 type:complete len:177 (+) Transcript_39758:47-577(+)
MGCLASKPVVAEPSFPAEDVTSKIEIALPTLLGKYGKPPDMKKETSTIENKPVVLQVPFDSKILSPLQQREETKPSDDEAQAQLPAEITSDDLEHKEISTELSTIPSRTTHSSDDRGLSDMFDLRPRMTDARENICTGIGSFAYLHECIGLRSKPALHDSKAPGVFKNNASPLMIP